MKDTVYKNIIENQLICKGDKVLVGVSGGCDSIFLLNILNTLKTEIGFELIIVHINHLYRGESAFDDEEFVKNQAEKLGLKFIVYRKNMDEFAKKSGISKEDAGRRIRYEFFNEALIKEKANSIAVAHNKDDQAETIFMRFLRGSGLDGLKGMDFKNGYIIRPILNISRREIEEFIFNNNLSYREDPTNSEKIYLRNRIRLDLLKKIKDEYNENIINILYNTGRIIKEENDFIAEIAKREMDNVFKIEENSGVLDLISFNKLHIGIKRRILREIIKSMTGNIQNIGFIEFERIFDICKKNTGVFMYIKDLRIINSYDKLLFKFHKAEIKKPKIESLEFLPGESIDFNGNKILSKIIKRGEMEKNPSNRNTVYFPLSKLDGKLCIRYRKAGDKFNPFGMKGVKKLKDFFIDEKIEKDLRNLIPLICFKNDILWVTGYRRCNGFKVTPEDEDIVIFKKGDFL